MISPISDRIAPARHRTTAFGLTVYGNAFLPGYRGRCAVAEVTGYLLLGGAIALCFVCSIRWPLTAVFIAINSYVMRSALPPNLGPISPELADDILSVGVPVIVIGTILLRSLQLARTRTFKLSQMDVLAISGTVLLAAGSLYSPNMKEGAEIAARYTVLCAGYYFAVRLLSLRLGRMALLLRFAEVSFIGAILLAAWTWVTPILTTGQRLTVGSAHPIPFSLLLAVGIVSGIFLLERQRWITKLWTVLGLVIVSSQFLGTITRGTFIALGLAIGATLIVRAFPIFARVRPRTLLVAVGMATLLLGTMVALRPTQAVALLTSISRLTSSNMGTSATSRVEAYRTALEVGLDEPLLGVGTGGFKTVGELLYPHNFFLELFSENGLLGLTWGLLLAVSALYLASLAVTRGTSARSNAFGYFALTLFLLHFLEAQVSFTLWMQKGLFISLALLVEAANIRVLPSARRTPRPKLVSAPEIFQEG